MKEYKIAAAAAGQRLDRFLAKILPKADTAFLHRMLRKKNITRNDKKAEGSERVEAGDVIRLWFSEETFRKVAGTQPDSRRYPRWDGFSAAVILENEMLLAINKPAGMLSQKATPADVSLNEYMLSYLISRNEFQPENPNGFRPGGVNRLDRNTSGLVLAAKTRAAAEELSVQLRDKRLRKYYLACVKGEVREAERLSAFLYKDKEKNQVQIHSRKSCAALDRAFSSDSRTTGCRRSPHTRRPEVRRSGGKCPPRETPWRKTPAPARLSGTISGGDRCARRAASAKHPRAAARSFPSAVSGGILNGNLEQPRASRLPARGTH